MILRGVERPSPAIQRLNPNRNLPVTPDGVRLEAMSTIRSIGTGAIPTIT